jgi:hypothetical protein
MGKLAMVKRVPMTNKHTDRKSFLVDDKDFYKIKDFKWRVAKIKNDYLCIQRKRLAKERNISDRILLSRQVMGVLYDKKVQVDHIERSRWFDNTRKNLRICTHSENCRNSRIRSNNRLGLKGVSEDHGHFSARIFLNKKQVVLGWYTTKYEAAISYDDAARKYFGEFARLNYPRKGERSARS